METHRIQERYSDVVFIVITLFLIICLFGSDVFATTHYPLLNQSNTTITAPPVFLQAGTAGTSTIYANNTSAKVNVTAPENQYVTQQSNIDGVADVGTHSNFTAQQYGPDNISDNLTEANTPYIPITFNNTQSSATPNPFQEKMTWNPSSYTSYEASDLGNIRFYNDRGLTTPLYAWLENCTPLSNTATSATAWVKLTTSIAGNGGTLTIYMAFLSTSTDFDGNYWGDAPNLSPSYGQYDNGANVFSFYDNFNGTSLSSKWTSIIGSSGASIAVNNGLTVTTTNTGSSAYAFVISATQPYPAVAETYTSSGNSILGVSNTTSLNGFVAPYFGYSMDWYAGHDDLEYEGSSSTQLSSLSQSTFPAGIWQVTWSATRAQYFADGAGNTYTGTYSGAAIANYRIYVGQSNGIISSSVFRWARMRAYPPSNVMPSVSFGSLTSSNYRLEIEEQWTNVNNAAANEELDVYMGAFSTPASILSVQWYNTTSSSWLTIISSLNTSAWNNVTVVNYLTSSTFTMQFVNTTSGTTQSWWQIDCALLHLWTNSTYDYVLSAVNQVTNAWNVSLQVNGSSNITRLSSATISFHDGTSSNQIVVNGGSIVQSQGALYNLLGGSGTTVYISMSNLLANATGASYLYVYLEILTPNTSTFLFYAITFAVT